jgi:hypothetical protein
MPDRHFFEFLGIARYAPRALASLAPAVSKTFKPSVFAQGLRRTGALNQNLPFVDGHYLGNSSRLDVDSQVGKEVNLPFATERVDTLEAISKTNFGSRSRRP